MAAGGGDLNISQQLHDWAVNTMHFVPSGRYAGSKMPSVEDFQLLCRGPANDVWRYVIAHVRPAKTVRTVKGNLMLQQMRSKALQPESAEAGDTVQADLAAKKRALMSELASTMSATQVLEHDIKRLRKEIVTTEQSYRSAVSQINDMRRKKALLSAHSRLSQENAMRIEEFAKQLQHKHEQLSELRRRSSQPAQMMSRSTQSAEPSSASSLETVSMKMVRETCEVIAAFLEQLYDGSFEGNEQAMIHSKNEMRKCVEAALTDITPNELLSTLCAYTEETSLALSQKTAAIDITNDVEQLRFKYEQDGRLSDVSSPPSVLQSIHRLLEAAQSAMFARFIETEKHKNNSWQLQKRLNEASVAVDDRLRQLYSDPQQLQLARKLVDTEMRLASSRASVSALNTISDELTAKLKQAMADKEILYAKHQKIQDFNKLTEKKQDLIRVLVKQNMNSRSRLQTHQSENTAYVQRMLSSHTLDVESLRDSVVTEANAFIRLPLCLLPTVTMASGERVAVVDLSIHKLDADLPLVHCSRTISNLLSDLNIPPFIASELLLPRVVELRTDCATAEILLQIRRRNSRQADIEHVSLQLHELCDKAEDNDKQLTDRLLPVVRQRIDAATQALSDCLQLKDLTHHWWEQPAQLCTPWITVDGMNLQQWLTKWKVIASSLRQLPATSTAD